MYILTYKQRYVYTYLHMYIFTNIHTYIYIHIYVYTNIHIYIFTSLKIYIFTYTSGCVSLSLLHLSHAAKYMFEKEGSIAAFACDPMIWDVVSLSMVWQPMQRPSVPCKHLPGSETSTRRNLSVPRDRVSLRWWRHRSPRFCFSPVCTAMILAFAWLPALLMLLLPLPCKKSYSRLPWHLSRLQHRTEAISTRSLLWVRHFFGHFVAVLQAKVFSPDAVKNWISALDESFANWSYSGYYSPRDTHHPHPDSVFLSFAVTFNHCWK